MSEPVIQVRGLGKSYQLGDRARLDRTIPETIDGAARRAWRSIRGAFTPLVDDGDSTCQSEAGSCEPFWALRGVDFDVDRGEVIGIVGRNGAGKSTLLKLLSRITDPTEGQVTLKGRVASLLEVGTGFHPELTGRENIYLNGSILGLGRSQIAARFDEIVEFSGVEAFLDTPIKRYSTGMAVRLAFAVAAHLDPEILIVDEVLAVGDAEFQKKCIGRMRDVATDEGRTVLFVSHNMDSIVHLSSRVMVLDRGRTSGCESVDEGVQRYYRSMTADTDAPMLDRPRAAGTGHTKLFSGLTIRGDGRREGVVPCGGSLTLEIDVTQMGAVRSGECGVIVTNERGQRVAAFQSLYHANLTLKHMAAGRVTCHVPSLSLVPGTYYVDLLMSDDRRVVDHVERAGSFEVVFADLFGTGRLPNASQCQVVLPSQWKVAA